MALIDELNVTIQVSGQERLEKMQTDLKTLSSAATEVKNDINELKTAVKALGTALDKASPKRHVRAQKELAKQTKETGDALKKEAKDAAAMGKAAEETAKSKEKAAKATEKQAAAVEKAAKKTRKAKNEVDEFGAAMDKVSGKKAKKAGLSLSDLNKKAATLFTTVTNLKKKLDSFRVASTFGFVGAVVAGVAGGVLSGGWRQSDINTRVKQAVYEYGGYPGGRTEEIVDAARQLGERFKSADPNQITKAISEMMHPRLEYGVDEAKKLANLILNIAGATGGDAGYLASAIRQVLLEYKIDSASAEKSILQMFDTTRKTGVPMLEVAHYMADMAEVARRTGTGYEETLLRAGQAWYAGADPRLIFGAIYQLAQGLTGEYKGRFQESIETLRTTDMTDREFRQAWLNLFKKDFPGPSDEVYDFLIALRKKQLWSHEMEELVQSFAASHGYDFAGLYTGDQTYRKQVDTIMTDVFKNKNPSIAAQLPDDVLDAINLMKGSLDESTKKLQNIDVNTDEIVAMRQDVKSGWDRMIDAIKSFFTPLIHFVGGLYRSLVPKQKREDIERERLGEEVGLPYGGEQIQRLHVSDAGLIYKGMSVLGHYTNNDEALINQLKKAYPYGTFQLVKRRRGGYFTSEPKLSEIIIDPVAQLIAKGLDETVNLTQPVPTSTPLDNVPEPGNGAAGTPQIVNNYYKVEGNVSSLHEMTHNLEQASMQSAKGTGW